MLRVVIFICVIYGLVTLSCTKDDIPTPPPEEREENHKRPVAIPMDDTIVSIKDSVILHVDAKEGNAPIEWYFWSFDEDNGWSPGNRDGTYKRYFSTDDTGKHKILVKAVDSFYVESKPDSFSVQVKEFPPVIKPVNDTIVALNDKVVINVKATDAHETRGVRKYYWDIGANGWDDSTDEASYTFSNPKGGLFTVIWGASDFDDHLITDTFSIIFNRPPASLAMVEPGKNDSAHYIGFNKAKNNGTVRIRFSAKDPEGELDTLTYTFYHGKDKDNLKEIYKGKDTILDISDLTLETKYHWRIHVRDIYGDDIELTGSYITEKIDLFAPDLSLKGDNPLKTSLGVNFIDPGVIAIDNNDGDISDSVKISGTVNTMKAGTYEITYTVSDSVDNDTSAIRTVIVEEYILVENFESGPPYQSAFGEIFGNDPTDTIGCWYKKEHQAGFLPDPYKDNDTAFNSVVVESAGFDSSYGLATWIRMWWPPDAKWSIGVNIKKANESYDLSKLDSITFYAKNGPQKGGQHGKTNIIRFECTYPAGRVGKEIQLTDSWKKYRLTPNDLTGWNKAKKNIRALQFKESIKNRKDVHLFVDDIRLYGSFSNHEILKR